MKTRETNDVAELTRLGLSTFLNIGQMARYRSLYIAEKDSRKNNPVQVNACELDQNREKMITHTCLAALGIFALLAFGIVDLMSKE